MGDIIEKMGDDAPERLTGIYILLPAIVTESSIKVGVTVQANFFSSLPGMRHYVNFAKNTQSRV